MRFLFLILLLGVSTAAFAQKPTTKVAAPGRAVNQFADPTLRRIATAQDERNPAALQPFLTDKNPAYRRAAALAFASVQDKAAVPALLPLLEDGQAPVRRAAAYALGQTGDSTAVPALLARLAKETNFAARRSTHEALGRCVPARFLPLLWKGASTTDTLRSAGLAWALARAAQRGLVTEESMSQAAAILGQGGGAAYTRLGAATALARSRGQDSTLARVAGAALLRTAQNDPDYAVRATSVAALARFNNRPAVAEALPQLASLDPDVRVRVAALRALPGAPYDQLANFAHAALRRGNEQEALTGAEWFLKNGAGHAAAILDELGYADHWRARAVLLAATLRHTPPKGRPGVRSVIEDHFGAARTDYEKGQLLQALGEDAGAFDFIQAATFAPRVAPVVASSGLGALVALRSLPDFPAARQADFEAALRRALGTGDVGLLSPAAEAYASARLVPAPQPADLAALRQARDQLQLPRDIEAWQALQQTLDKLEKAPRPTPVPVGKASQHPIDWALVQTIPARQRVRLQTSQGDIILQLKVEDAPGAVGSFVALVRQHFYDGLYFHRVVPNFVAQGGDPRGDGAGSAPFTLRSELPELHYGEGTAGLASAGKDTESCQFFLTHTPTPHLDGRYPIFGQVVRGLDVLQKLEVGDQLLKVELLTEKPAGPARIK